MSRATITSSEQPGIPRRPSRTDSAPSCMSPPALRCRSSQWLITGIPRLRADSMARRITRAFITGRPSSEMATAPAFFMDPIAASSSPALPLVIAPIGKYVDHGVPPRLLDHVAGDRGVIVHRLGVGHGADRREPARGRRARSALDGLGMLEARLAQMHVHVDEPRRHDQPRRVDNFRARPSREIRPDALDDAVLDPHIRHAVVTATPDRSRGRS